MLKAKEHEEHEEHEQHKDEMQWYHQQYVHQQMCNVTNLSPSAAKTWGV